MRIIDTWCRITRLETEVEDFDHFLVVKHQYRDEEDESNWMKMDELYLLDAIHLHYPDHLVWRLVKK